MSEADHRVLRIDSYELYWGEIDTSGLPPIPFGRFRPAAERQRLSHQFDPVLPVAVEDVHAVYRSIGRNRVIACGIDRDRIAAFHAEGWEAVVPADVPEAFLGHSDSPPDPNGFDLLTAEFAPVSVTSRRRRRRDLIAASLGIAGLIVTAGNLRLVSQVDDATASARAQQRDLYDDALGPVSGATPPAVRLTAELRRLSATRGEEVVLDRPAAELDLQQILASWPHDQEIRVERLFVQPNRIDITAEAADATAVAALVEALGTMENWSLDSERFDGTAGSDGETVRARLGYIRSAPGGSS